MSFFSTATDYSQQQRIGGGEDLSTNTISINTNSNSPTRNIRQLFAGVSSSASASNVVPASAAAAGEHYHYPHLPPPFAGDSPSTPVGNAATRAPSSMATTTAAAAAAAAAAASAIANHNNTSAVAADGGAYSTVADAVSFLSPIHHGGGTVNSKGGGDVSGIGGGSGSVVDPSSIANASVMLMMGGGAAQTADTINAKTISTSSTSTSRARPAVMGKSPPPPPSATASSSSSGSRRYNGGTAVPPPAQGAPRRSTSAAAHGEGRHQRSGATTVGSSVTPQRNASAHSTAGSSRHVPRDVSATKRRSDSSRSVPKGRQGEATFAYAPTPSSSSSPPLLVVEDCCMFTVPRITVRGVRARRGEGKGPSDDFSSSSSDEEEGYDADVAQLIATNNNGEAVERLIARVLQRGQQQRGTSSSLLSVGDALRCTLVDGSLVDNAALHLTVCAELQPSITSVGSSAIPPATNSCYFRDLVEMGLVVRQGGHGGGGGGAHNHNAYAHYTRAPHSAVASGPLLATPYATTTTAAASRKGSSSGAADRSLPMLFPADEVWTRGGVTNICDDSNNTNNTINTIMPANHHHHFGPAATNGTIRSSVSPNRSVAAASLYSAVPPPPSSPLGHPHAPSTLASVSLAHDNYAVASNAMAKRLLTAAMQPTSGSGSGGAAMGAQPDGGGLGLLLLSMGVDGRGAGSSHLLHPTEGIVATYANAVLSLIEQQNLGQLYRIVVSAVGVHDDGALRYDVIPPKETRRERAQRRREEEGGAPRSMVGSVSFRHTASNTTNCYHKGGGGGLGNSRSAATTPRRQSFAVGITGGGGAAFSASPSRSLGHHHHPYGGAHTPKRSSSFASSAVGNRQQFGRGMDGRGGHLASAGGEEEDGGEEAARAVECPSTIVSTRRQVTKLMHSIHNRTMRTFLVDSSSSSSPRGAAATAMDGGSFGRPAPLHPSLISQGLGGGGTSPRAIIMNSAPCWASSAFAAHNDAVRAMLVPLPPRRRLAEAMGIHSTSSAGGGEAVIGVAEASAMLLGVAGAGGSFSAGGGSGGEGRIVRDFVLDRDADLSANSSCYSSDDACDDGDATIGGDTVMIPHHRGMGMGMGSADAASELEIIQRLAGAKRSGGGGVSTPTTSVSAAFPTTTGTMSAQHRRQMAMAADGGSDASSPLRHRNTTPPTQQQHQRQHSRRDRRHTLITVSVEPMGGVGLGAMGMHHQRIRPVTFVDVRGLEVAPSLLMPSTEENIASAQLIQQQQQQSVRAYQGLSQDAVTLLQALSAVGGGGGAALKKSNANGTTTPTPAAITSDLLSTYARTSTLTALLSQHLERAAMAAVGPSNINTNGATSLFVVASVGSASPSLAVGAAAAASAASLDVTRSMELLRRLAMARYGPKGPRRRLAAAHYPAENPNGSREADVTTPSPNTSSAGARHSISSSAAPRPSANASSAPSSSSPHNHPSPTATATARAFAGLVKTAAYYRAVAYAQAAEREHALGSVGPSSLTLVRRLQEVETDRVMLRSALGASRTEVQSLKAELLEAKQQLQSSQHALLAAAAASSQSRGEGGGGGSPFMVAGQQLLGSTSASAVKDAALNELLPMGSPLGAAMLSSPIAGDMSTSAAGGMGGAAAAGNSYQLTAGGGSGGNGGTVGGGSNMAAALALAQAQCVSLAERLKAAEDSHAKAQEGIHSQYESLLDELHGKIAALMEAEVEVAHLRGSDDNRRCSSIDADGNGADSDGARGMRRGSTAAFTAAGSSHENSMTAGPDDMPHYMHTQGQPSTHPPSHRRRNGSVVGSVLQAVTATSLIDATLSEADRRTSDGIVEVLARNGIIAPSAGLEEALLMGQQQQQRHQQHGESRRALGQPAARRVAQQMAHSVALLQLVHQVVEREKVLAGVLGQLEGMARSRVDAAMAGADGHRGEGGGRQMDTTTSSNAIRAPSPAAKQGTRTRTPTRGPPLPSIPSPSSSPLSLSCASVSNRQQRAEAQRAWEWAARALEDAPLQTGPEWRRVLREVSVECMRGAGVDSLQRYLLAEVEGGGDSAAASAHRLSHNHSHGIRQQQQQHQDSNHQHHMESAAAFLSSAFGPNAPLPLWVAAMGAACYPTSRSSVASSSSSALRQAVAHLPPLALNYSAQRGGGPNSNNRASSSTHGGYTNSILVLAAKGTPKAFAAYWGSGLAMPLVGGGSRAVGDASMQQQQEQQQQRITHHHRRSYGGSNSDAAVDPSLLQMRGGDGGHRRSSFTTSPPFTPRRRSLTRSGSGAGRGPGSDDDDGSSSDVALLNATASPPRGDSFLRRTSGSNLTQRPSSSSSAAAHHPLANPTASLTNGSRPIIPIDGNPNANANANAGDHDHYEQFIRQVSGAARFTPAGSRLRAGETFRSTAGLSDDFESIRDDETEYHYPHNNRSDYDDDAPPAPFAGPPRMAPQPQPQHSNTHTHTHSQTGGSAPAAPSGRATSAAHTGTTAATAAAASAATPMAAAGPAVGGDGGAQTNSTVSYHTEQQQHIYRMERRVSTTTTQRSVSARSDAGGGSGSGDGEETFADNRTFAAPPVCLTATSQQTVVVGSLTNSGKGGDDDGGLAAPPPHSSSRRPSYGSHATLSGTSLYFDPFRPPVSSLPSNSSVVVVAAAGNPIPSAQGNSSLGHGASAIANTSANGHAAVVEVSPTSVALEPSVHSPPFAPLAPPSPVVAPAAATSSMLQPHAAPLAAAAADCASGTTCNASGAAVGRVDSAASTTVKEKKEKRDKSDKKEKSEKKEKKDKADKKDKSDKKEKKEKKRDANQGDAPISESEVSFTDGGIATTAASSVAE